MVTVRSTVTRVGRPAVATAPIAFLAGKDSGNEYSMMMMAQAASSGNSDDEAMVPQPGVVKFQVIVNAAFKLK